MIFPRIKKKLKKLFISVNTIFVGIFHPTITLYTLGIFDCVKVEGAWYMSRDITLECWSDLHYHYAFLYGLPSLLIWIISYTLVIFVILKKSKKNLDNESIILKYGIYYRGFKDDYFFWDILVVNVKRMLYMVLTLALLEKS